ncbi:MAG TPA: hypothetical protein VIM07_15440 [Chitinophagaceae bacterium]
MNLFALADAPLNDHLLQDGIWQKADFYDLSTGSTFWNRAGMITLTKTYAQTPATALIYLLQKETRVLQIWEREWGDTTPTVHDFIHFFMAEGGFTNAEGQLITIESFWEKYSATITGITAAPGFEFSKNEIAGPFTDLLNKAEIIQVICFDDTWDEQNFLIETETDWVLFHWASAA